MPMKEISWNPIIELSGVMTFSRGSSTLCAIILIFSECLAELVVFFGAFSPLNLIEWMILRIIHNLNYDETNSDKVHINLIISHMMCICFQMDGKNDLA